MGLARTQSGLCEGTYANGVMEGQFDAMPMRGYCTRNTHLSGVLGCGWL